MASRSTSHADPFCHVRGAEAIPSDMSGTSAVPVTRLAGELLPSRPEKFTPSFSQIHPGSERRYPLANRADATDRHPTPAAQMPPWRRMLWNYRHRTFAELEKRDGVDE